LIASDISSIGFNQDPKIGWGFDESRAFLVKLGTADYLPACEGDNVHCRAKTLRTEQTRLWFEHTRTVDRPISMRNAAPAASICLPLISGAYLTAIARALNSGDFQLPKRYSKFCHNNYCFIFEHLTSSKFL